MTRDLTQYDTGSVCDGCKFFPSCRYCVLLTGDRVVPLPCQPESKRHGEYEEQYRYATSGKAQ